MHGDGCGRPGLMQALLVWPLVSLYTIAFLDIMLVTI